MHWNLAHSWQRTYTPAATAVDEEAVLQRAQTASEAMLDRTGLRSRLEIQEGFWGHSKYPS